MRNAGRGSKNDSVPFDLDKIIAEAGVVSDDVLRKAVKLPQKERLEAWLAVNIIDFYNQINMLYGTITELCSPKTCPKMLATSKYEYLWSFQTKNSNGRRMVEPPVSVSAPQYVEALMRWCQEQFDDETIFPAKISGKFPKSFVDRHAKPIMKKLVRVYLHMYCHHLNEIIELNLIAVMNTCFKHYCIFATEFDFLVDLDYGPLAEIVTNFANI